MWQISYSVGSWKSPKFSSDFLTCPFFARYGTKLAKCHT